MYHINNNINQEERYSSQRYYDMFHSYRTKVPSQPPNFQNYYYGNNNNNELLTSNLEQASSMDNNNSAAESHSSAEYPYLNTSGSLGFYLPTSSPHLQQSEGMNLKNIHQANCDQYNTKFCENIHNANEKDRQICNYETKTIESNKNTNEALQEKPPERHIKPTMQTSDEEKRAYRRMKNKLAAARCRQRRADHINALSTLAEHLKSEVEKLQKNINELQTENQELDYILKFHSPCLKQTFLEGISHDLRMNSQNKIEEKSQNSYQSNNEVSSYTDTSHRNYNTTHTYSQENIVRIKSERE